ncbi:expressed unknown protein [Seminavis robusta]|uniref:Potassium channel domain-containing protein n=1 Tax=Seminavis robusta TaxID=568900 RepID=A0A9N8EP07_9STRA|nr:expressed unknown protein [Seminavis robusta]|eukprot:Sro1558_g282400.1 n/a (315) ;mRNA; r:21972-23082
MSTEVDNLLTTPPTTVSYSHRLKSHEEGESAVERLAAKIEHRRGNRLGMTYDARLQLETMCHEIALRNNCDNPKDVRKEDLLLLRKLFDSQVIGQQQRNPLLRWRETWLGIKTTEKYLLEAVDRALHHVEETQDCLHFTEWIALYSKEVHKWPWMRNESANAFLVVVAFFILTPILFCQVMRDRNICGDPSSGISWLNGCYMASVTLSTVGYGDVTVGKDNVYIGTAYMIVSVCVSITAFSAAAGDAFSPLRHFYKTYLRFDEEDVAEGAPLSKKLWRIRLFRCVLRRDPSGRGERVSTGLYNQRLPLAMGTSS